MADTSPEIVHQHYANSTAAIAAMNDKNWAFEESGDRLIVMDGATPRYFDTTANILASGSFILNQTASAQTAGFNVSGNGIVGGTFTVAGVADFATTVSIVGVLTTTASVVVGSGLTVGTNATVGGNVLVGGAGNGNIIGGQHLILQAHDGGDYVYIGDEASFYDQVRIGGNSLRVLDITGNAVALNGAFTLSALSSGRIPVVSTAGLITQDNLYWDATNDRLGVGSGASSPSSDIFISKATVGSEVQITAFNSDNTSGLSHARILARSGGASGGDGFITTSNNVADWSFGVDNSDADAFVLSEASTLGTSNRLRIASGGAVTIPGTLGVTGAITGSNLSGTNTGDQTNISGNAATVTTNANLTGPITSVGNATAIASQTGTGTTFMMSASPTTTGTLTAAIANFSGTVTGQSSVWNVGMTTIDADIYGKLRFRRYDSAGTLSTSGGSPTSLDVSLSSRFYFNVDPGVGNSSYVTFTNGYDGQVIFAGNDTGRQVYITNGGNQVNPLAAGYNVMLVYDNTTWRVYGTGF